MMKIEQFEDKGLAHYAYVVLSESEMVVIDPARNPKPYYEYAMMHDARIKAVIETHPHADFVSGHLEIATTKEVPVYVSRLAEVEYEHTPFDEGDKITVGKVTLEAINTPGHSPDSISILLRDEAGKPHALFSGDTLFIGDVGRPDLRETGEDLNTDRRELARAMYRTIHEKLLPLPDDVLVYPAHGAGSLCGKGMSSANSSTIGQERRSNAALQNMTEDQFLDYLLTDQPFVPKYFAYDVALNRKGAPDYTPSLNSVPRFDSADKVEKGAVVVDARPQTEFRKGHLPGAINIMDGGKFETWLGSLVGPEETFYLIVSDEEQAAGLLDKAAKIGYEQLLAGVVLNPEGMNEVSPELNLEAFKQQPEAYTIIDVRNASEVKQQQIFPNAVSIPLPELRERVHEIPTDKPVLVHCAGGYRSAAGASIIQQEVKSQPVYDLSEAIKNFS